MPCLSPMSAWENPRGGRLLFSPPRGFEGVPPLSLPCGKCLWCRMERSRQWAVRCIHENLFHQKSCFVTLTYRNSSLPRYGSLHLSDLQKFLKRLRKDFDQSIIRYFGCGEYGESFARPHYHLLIFGVDFSDDRVSIGNNLYRSPRLEKLWPFGFSTVGSVTFESAAYVARYCLKKVGGYDVVKSEHYKKRKPEFVVMSRRPGIGSQWFDKYKFDVYPYNSTRREGVNIDGLVFKTPRYYDKLLEKEMPSFLEKIKETRKANVSKFAKDETQLQAFEANLKARLSLFTPRNFEGIQ